MRMNRKPKSSCCNAELIVVSGGEGTNHYQCTKCGRPADPKPDYVMLTEGQVIEENDEYEGTPGKWFPVNYGRLRKITIGLPWSRKSPHYFKPMRRKT